MIVTIHQPVTLPWLGFFHKAASADELILLDHVQYRKNYLQNRNRIKSASGPIWLTVPVVTKGLGPQPICEVEIAERTNPRWRERHRRSIEQCYSKAPHYEAYAEGLLSLYERPFRLLVDFNIAILLFLARAFGIGTKLLRSSELSPAFAREDMLLDLCQKRGADTYLSGVSGRSYLTPQRWEAAGIRLQFQAFYHPIYPQGRGDFVPAMSAIDLLFYCGPRSLDAILGRGFPVMDHVFE